MIKRDDFMKYSLLDMKFAYTAGLFDGEGSINARLPRYNLRISMTSTDKCVMDFLIENFGGNVYEFQPKAKKTYLLQYHWEMAGESAANFLSYLMPYLVIKKERATVGIALFYTAPGTLERKQLYDKLKKLNHPKAEDVINAT